MAETPSTSAATLDAQTRAELREIDERCHALKARASREFGAGSPEYCAIYAATKPLCDLTEKQGAL